MCGGCCVYYTRRCVCYSPRGIGIRLLPTSTKSYACRKNSVYFSVSSCGRSVKSSSPKAAKEERTLDDTVALDRAVPLLLRVVEGFLLAHQCNRIIEGVNRLNVSADRLLQAFKLSADLLCVGALARFNN